MDPPDWTMDPPGVEPAEGGGVRIKWLNHLKGTFRCDKSLRHQNDCPQYIPKGKQTPASKLAFVIFSFLVETKFQTIEMYRI